VGIAAADLEESTWFYEDLLGIERIPMPRFADPVQWLPVGNLQLSLFLDEGSARARHRVGVVVDDFGVDYDDVKARPSGESGWKLVELPSRQVQLYFRYPARNLIELKWPGADSLDRSRYPELTRLTDHIPQSADSLRANLYLEIAS
jgi:catechol 2,3-dioxygenase-like lactoylglutathione lyase family enzyme